MGHARTRPPREQGLDYNRSWTQGNIPDPVRQGTKRDRWRFPSHHHSGRRGGGGPKRLVCTGICRALRERGLEEAGADGTEGGGDRGSAEDRGDDGPDLAHLPTATPGATCTCGEGDEEVARRREASFLELDESWKADAACVGTGPKKRGDPDPYFPEKGLTALVNVAVRTCFGCSVIAQCRSYRESTNSGYGVWGGEQVQRGKS